MNTHLIGLVLVMAFLEGCEGKSEKPEPAVNGTFGEVKLSNLFGRKPGDAQREPLNPPVLPGASGATEAARTADAANVFRSPQELVAGLPADARPRSINDQVRIDRANDWLKANVVGKRFEWDHYFGVIRLGRLPGGSKYRVTLRTGDIFTLEASLKAQTYTLHGQQWMVTPFLSSIDLGEVDTSVADRISGRTNKFLKVNAEILGAQFRDGSLRIDAVDFIVEGYSPARPKLAEARKAVPQALKNVKSPNPAVRAEAARLLACVPVEGKAALTDLINMTEEKDQGVREAAISAITAIDAGHKAVADFIPAKASADGKYAKLLIRFHAPEDRPTYGEFRDYGVYPAAGDAYGFKLLPAGY